MPLEYLPVCIPMIYIIREDLMVRNEIMKFHNTENKYISFSENAAGVVSLLRCQPSMRIVIIMIGRSNDRLIFIIVHYTRKDGFYIETGPQHVIVCFVFIIMVAEDRPGPVNSKMPSYQYRNFHCGNKAILRPSNIHNGIPFRGKTTFLYWIKALVGDIPVCC